MVKAFHYFFYPKTIFNMDMPNSLPEQLLIANINTDYSFTHGGRTIVIRLDAPNSELLSYLEQEQITQWAFLTAWNPTSYPQTEAYNRGQQEELLSKLRNYNVYKGESKSRDRKQPVVESVFVAGISREEASQLGWDFGQYAILVSNEVLEPELLPCPIGLHS